MKSLNIENVTELDWWESRDITTISGRTGQISCLPAQHMTARGLFDRYHTLWASWSFESGGKNIWFAGDTAYRSYSRNGQRTPSCPAFKDIGRLRGPFDLAMIPIGAYKPRYLLSPVHVDPAEAVEIFQDIKAKKAVGMHWGTFVLSSEDILEPRDELRRITKEKMIDFDTVVLGGHRGI
ncbi:N-acyl-phosphatidylethanolamine-hydrolyzing phospholipase D [Neolecta irregularis DAH-3]|uniref:N-acyl-phosphatidylethanolamine-hydrolyzing phospholipase D n=1 Tax=Neolecta irregularis (strain DAH-3) TaxID=1198029 RepID=A0A1U7LPX0_NEOID|nr:N-acyl-phosphatidylethanolamine-hydrolyzing phospholipase D [Neolecta irregularis DAH-3]|eukprot:OLL24720.1 N-acyl-phosphatidylethanolamine-hydrolyzing phospholipase D [Neolecta irregularis DAH-3]